MRVLSIILFSFVSAQAQSLSTGVLLSQGRFQPTHFTQGVYYGNSLVVGAGATLGTNRWTTRLSVRFSVTETNFWVGGQTLEQLPFNNFVMNARKNW